MALNRGGFVQESIWRNPEFRALPRSAQTMYCQLITQKEIDKAGMLPYQPTKWVKACDDMTLADLIADLKVLETANFIIVDEDTDEVLVRSYMRNAGVVAIPNVLKNALKSAALVESEPCRRALAEELRRIGKTGCADTANAIDPGPESGPPEPSHRTVSEPFEKGIGTVPEPFPKGLTVPEGFPKGSSESESESEGLSSLVVQGGASHAHTHVREAGPSTAPPPPPPTPNQEPVTRGALALVPDLDPDPEPPRRCRTHDRPDAPDVPCRGCQRAREAHEAWTARQRHTRADAGAVRRSAIDACPACDDHGWLLDPDGLAATPAVRCRHGAET